MSNNILHQMAEDSLVTDEIEKEKKAAKKKRKKAAKKKAKKAAKKKQRKKG
jgi:hypothetical protein